MPLFFSWTSTTMRTGGLVERATPDSAVREGPRSLFRHGLNRDELAHRAPLGTSLETYDEAKLEGLGEPL